MAQMVATAAPAANPRPELKPPNRRVPMGRANMNTITEV
jgi:hypothetical protein